MIYPIGIQTFANLREGGMVYVDKTAIIHEMIRTCKVNFLSRPRRFGKSLLVSTLEAYFHGRRELFKGLAMERLEAEWEAYPVLSFSMARAKHVDADGLESMLGLQLGKYEAVYGVNKEATKPNERLGELIEAAYRKTGKKVVILIDEYDAPMLDVLHEESTLKELRNVMRNFYSPLKDCEKYTEFLFITGITKFSQLSIFSELNSLRNISLDPRFAAICGITEEELTTQLSEGIDDIAAANDMTRDEAFAKLKQSYDGYHFAWPSPDVYNPFSLLRALDARNFGSYWFESGTPTFLLEMLRKYNVSPQELSTPTEEPVEGFDAPAEALVNVTPLLYQSGYATIKGYDRETELYTLAFPNREIRIGLLKCLLTNYVGLTISTKGVAVISRMTAAIRKDDMDGALRLIQTYLLTVPQTCNTDYEGRYQQILYVIFSLLGMFVDVEVHTPKGRVDMVLQTAQKLYVVELKLDKSAAVAMAQIDLKDYDKRFALCGLPVVKVGVNFNSETRTIDDWQIA